jgi:signal peptidase I
MTENVRAARSSEKTGAVHEIVEIIKTVVYALLIALFLRVLLFQPFTIPSASMEPNLLEGDYIIVSKYSYGYSHHSIPLSPPIFKGRIMERTPARGDIIVFKLPSNTKIDYIKRLVGLPGDRIQMREGLLYINGRQVPREQVGGEATDLDFHAVKQFRETFPNGRSFLTDDRGTDQDLDNTEVFVVPEGYYFFMGDNRDNSLDSRVAPPVGVGFVPAENLIGRAQIILLSWDPEASIFKPWTWFLNVRLDRFFHVLK